MIIVIHHINHISHINHRLSPYEPRANFGGEATVGVVDHGLFTSRGLNPTFSSRKYVYIYTVYIIVYIYNCIYIYDYIYIIIHIYICICKWHTCYIHMIYIHIYIYIYIYIYIHTRNCIEIHLSLPIVIYTCFSRTTMMVFYSTQMLIEPINCLASTNSSERSPSATNVDLRWSK